MRVLYVVPEQFISACSSCLFKHIRLLMIAMSGLLLTGLLLTGCATGEHKSGKDSVLPSWVTKHSAMPGYYVGIGWSNTGDINEDRVISLNRARTEIGGEISTQLRSELRVEAAKDDLHGVRTELSQEINVVVEQELSGIEIVDSYHDPSQGYWVLARLSEARWQAIQEQERAELRERVEGAVHGTHRPSSLWEELERLAVAWKMLRESPHGSMVRGTLYGNESYLADAISSRYRDILSGLAVSLDNDTLTTAVDAPIEVRGRVTGESRVGRMPVSLTFPGRTDVAVTTVTDEKDTFRLSIPRKGRTGGRHDLTASVATDQLPSMQPLLPVKSVEAWFCLTLTKKPALLKMVYDGVPDRAAFENGIRRFLSTAELPVELKEDVRGTPGVYSITTELHVEDFPVVMQNAPRISEGYIAFTVRKGDVVLETIRTKEQREGGRTFTQAHHRVVASALKELERNERYREKISNAFLRR